MTGAQLAQAARMLVGTPFRLHGRDPLCGLDCVGVLAAAIGRPVSLPHGYTLRMRRMPEVSDISAELGLAKADGVIMPGDVLMLRLSPCQFHIAIAADALSIVHAHAGLRKIVLGPLPQEWPVTGHWRLQHHTSDL